MQGISLVHAGLKTSGPWWTLALTTAPALRVADDVCMRPKGNRDVHGTDPLMNDEWSAPEQSYGGMLQPL